MKQPATLSLPDFLPYRLSITANLVSDVIANAYRRLFGLGIPEWRVLAVVAGKEGLSQQAICIETRMDKVTVSRAAVALVHRGLVERRSGVADRRAQLLYLTEIGRSLYEQVSPKALELEAAIFGRFSQQELDMLSSLLARIDQAALDQDDFRSVGSEI